MKTKITEFLYVLFFTSGVVFDLYWLIYDKQLNHFETILLLFCIVLGSLVLVSEAVRLTLVRFFADGK